MGLNRKTNNNIFLSATYILVIVVWEGKGMTDQRECFICNNEPFMESFLCSTLAIYELGRPYFIPRRWPSYRTRTCIWKRLVGYCTHTHREKVIESSRTTNKGAIRTIVECAMPRPRS